MRRRTMPVFAAFAVTATLLVPTASAGTYAALDEVPVEGGELRLSKPISISVDGSTQEMIQFPLVEMRISIDVSGMMAEYTVDQVFENPLTETIEAVYVFPLGDDAAISGYEIVVGERTVKGEIKTREQARQVYDEAKSQGHTAGLLEQEKANVFSQRVANIPAGESVRVRFRYVELLDYDDGRYQLTFPMVVGPRYLPSANRGRRPVGTRPAGTPATPGTVSVPYHGSYGGPAVKLSARIDAGVPVTEMASPSHQIVATRLDDTASKIELDGSTGIANRDFIVRYRAAGKKTVLGALTHRNGADGFFVLVVQPKQDYKTGDIAPREVIFLIDRSGSMDGAPLDSARALAKTMLATLSPRDTFNIISFSSGVEELAGSPVAGDAAGKARGNQFLDTMTAGGGTEMQRGMIKSLKSKPGGDRVRMVYLLSDGFVGNDDVILGAAQKHLSHNRIFPIGIGSSPNRYLIDRLGEVGRGFPSYVASFDDAAEVATNLVRKSAYPYMTNLDVDWGGLDVKEVIPGRIPDVYAGMPMVIAGRYDKPGAGTVRVKATVGGRRVEVPIALELPAKSPRRPVAMLWARRRIHDLLAYDFGSLDDETRSKVTGLGLNFGLVTEFTSYVAVDRERVVASNGTIKTIAQPAPMPEGVSYQTTVGGGGGGAASPSAHNYGSGGFGGGNYAPPSRESHSGGGGGGGGYGGGGDIDPLTLAIALLLIPFALLLRRRRRGWD